MTTNHIVGVHVKCWQVGDRRLIPWLVDGSGYYIDGMLWVVDGKYIENTYKQPRAIEDTLAAALVKTETQNQAGQTETLYTAVNEVMCFEFRVIGTDSEYHAWGSIDFHAGDVNSETFEHDIDELIRLARRHFEANKFEDGTHFMNEITFVTLWEYDAYRTHDDLDEEWSLEGEIDIKRLWDIVTQLPGDKCRHCRGWGTVRPTNWSLAPEARPVCPHCVKGIVRGAP